MIYGLGAALGWGLADLWAAISGRRIGAVATVLTAQLVSAVLTTLLVLATGTDLSGAREVVGWLLPNALLMAGGYFALYRGLELGPVTVVSPILASYAIIPVLLAEGLLGERLSIVVALGIVVTIGGAMLSSTDLRLWGSGVSRAPGLPWAVASAVLFGFAAYVFGWAAHTAGWLPTLWISRISTTAVFFLAALLLRAKPFGGARDWTGGFHLLGLAALVGLVDLVGAVMYARGADVGYVSIVTAASATYPILPVLGGTFYLKERPAPNQVIGIAFVLAGLLAVGLG